VRLAALALFFLGLALALGPGDPQYGQYRVSNVDTRISQLLRLRLPFVEVVDAKAYDNCKDKQGQDYRDCLRRHTWAVPYSTLAATQEKARLIRKAWQRFEERYYWHVINRLNNPAFYVAYCMAGFRGGDLNPPLPPAKVSVDLGAIPQDVPGDPQFRDRLLQAMGRLDPAAAGSHALDVYYPLPQVPKEDFCDGLSLWLLPIMYIPGFCIDIPQIGFSWCTPGYHEDQPLWFNESEAQRRVNDGIANAVQRYYPEYLAEVAQVLSVPTVPTGFTPDTWYVYAPYPWKTHLLNGGAVAAPVVKDIKDPATTARDILAEVQDIYSAVMRGKGVVPAALQPSYVSYYAQSFLGLANYPGLSTVRNGILSLLQGVDQTAFSLARYALEVADGTEKLQNRRGYFTEDPRTGAPGVFPFEEVKRWFPIGSLPVQERFGYTSWFLAWNQMEATVIPTPKDAMGAFGLLQRVIVYWWVPVRVKITLTPWPPFISVTGSLDVPKPRPVPPYVLPFAGERTYWGWENVPEGYPIPKVKGTPLLPQGADYSILLRR
jgi:hypothetical protein